MDASQVSYNGSFHGPDLPPGSTNMSVTTPASETDTPTPRQSHQCLYIFIGGENERVKMVFSRMHLQSESPECLEEFVDIYSEIQDLDNDLLTSPFGGRFCDQYIPRDRVSLYRAIVLIFHTDRPQVIGEKAFAGSYEFINACKLNCAWLIR